MPIKVLFEGWRLLQHSYGTVLGFTLVHLWKLYGPNGLYKNKIIFYVKEMEYFRQEWKQKQKLVYSKEYNDILLGMQEWTPEIEVDIIYRHTYPYNINVTGVNKDIPKIVFYTSEFSQLSYDYFLLAKPKELDVNQYNDYISIFLKEYSNIYFVCPSKWSQRGMERYSITEDRNRVITHGVDNTVFYRIPTDTIRKAVRESYKISDNTTLMINIGAMTGNKGILLILEALLKLLKLGKDYKLFLKGTGDLYTCSQFVNNYVESMNLVAEDAILLHSAIIFLDKTLSYTKLNELFNACDVYISPYLAEGFGLTTLDALSSGLNVVVPSTGSTQDYIDYIYSNGGQDYIYKIDSFVSIDPNGLCQNSISINNLLDTILANEMKWRIRKSPEVYNKMSDYIQKKYSWYKVAEELYWYFLDVKNNI